MLPLLKRFGFVLLLALGIMVAWQNAESLSQSASFRLDFHVSGLAFETPAFPLAALLIGAFLVGMLFAGFQGIYERVARTVDIRRRDRRIRELEKELEECRGTASTGSRSLSTSPGAPAPPVPLEQNPTL
ncbi:MAG: DUF1049 domain-containing protein [Deltaproteobacteria bacterium]|nr:DUF1049 domain-containing protein [Deltaproteobacteria bacterium]